MVIASRFQWRTFLLDRCGTVRTYHAGNVHDQLTTGSTSGYHNKALNRAYHRFSYSLLYQREMGGLSGYNSNRLITTL